ncbi:MAG: helicase-related protein, partial [Clostridia bacterium]|nr:helicase-related protein [Clostridia bacterium]
AYIICPLIEESEALSAKSAVEYAESLKKSVFKNYSLAVLHGRLKPLERKEIMDRFSMGEIDILVSTTVIEVGVDVANATVMIIENAERFGLSQLHQLRGRIGRGSHESYCIMFSEGGKIAGERMNIMCKTCDGFKISEKDLELRGPGEFFGVRQHGLPELQAANLATDMELLSRAKAAAEKLLAKDPGLKNPENRLLKERIRSKFSEVSENGILN